MLNFGDSLYEAELRKDVLVEMEQVRPPRLMPGRQSPVPWSVLIKGNRRLMVWLGDVLVALGCELQGRFATESRTTVR